MHECEVPYAGRIWKSAEHAYQASKTVVADEQDMIFNMQHPRQTKVKGKTLTLREDWTTQTKLAIMRDIVRSKFTHNRDLREKLIQTYPMTIIEGNYWNDNFWGRCPIDAPVYGNHLGRILMELRREFMLEMSVEF